MDKYKKLISNTVIFAIGTFSSKVLVFLLMPLYTRVLSDAEYGITDLIVQTGNLLLPLASLGIVNERRIHHRFGYNPDRFLYHAPVVSSTGSLGLPIGIHGFNLCVCVDVQLAVPLLPICARTGPGAALCGGRHRQYHNDDFV